MAENKVCVVAIDAPKKPCSECPWRTDVETGVWPLERFIDLAATTYDMADRVFACHKSSQENPTACAGFLARGADNNKTVRYALMTGNLENINREGDAPLYENYRDMAVANGLDPDHPALAKSLSRRPE